MPAAQFTLPAATALKPLSQGSLSGLCGFYSILNAIQLVLYPHHMPRKQLQGLYLHGVSHLSRTRQLKSVLGAGMDEVTWLGLAKSLAEYVNGRHATSLITRQISNGSAQNSRAQALHRIRTTIQTGSPVLVGLGGALGHFTVLVGFTDRRLLFFDSSGLKWIDVAGIGLGDSSAKRHHLFTGSVSALIDDW